jgi:hypothetical protein
MRSADPIPLDVAHGPQAHRGPRRKRLLSQAGPPAVGPQNLAEPVP